MSAGDPTPAQPSPPESGTPSEDTRAKRSPWMWVAAGIAVIAVALAVWGLSERSDAQDAKADLQSQQQKTASPATTSAQTEASQPPTSTPQTQSTTTATTDDRQRIGVAALAAVGTAFAAARKALNENQAQVDELESDVDKANAEADQAQQDAEKAKEEAAAATASQEKQKAQAEEADAQKRQLRAKAEAAAACAKATVEIVGDIPKAPSLDEGLKNAADQINALVPECKDSVAAAGA
jgi:chromosome segregation ATPase